MTTARMQGRAEIHLRLARQQHDKLVLLARQQRATLNDLISGILHKTLQPPPDDTDTIFRRVERVEKAVQGLTTRITTLEQRLQSTTESTRLEVGQTRSEVHRLAQAHRALGETVERALGVQKERLESFVRQLVDQAAQERPGVYNKIRGFVIGALTETTDGRR